MPTSHETVRRAIARLRRKPFPSSVDRGQHGSKAYPIPYVADRPERDTMFVSHADGHNSIFLAGGVLCQVCGEYLLDDDTRIWLLTDDHENNRATHRERLAQMPHDSRGNVLVATSIGPLHPWCARVSLRFCPALRVVDPNHLVAWRCDTPPTQDAYLARYIFDEFGGIVQGYVEPERLLDLEQLDRIVEETKNITRSSTR